jgi:hypothetical protein
MVAPDRDGMSASVAEQHQRGGPRHVVLYNVETGTVAASSTIQAVTTTLVIVQAVVLVGLELLARRAGLRSVLGPRPT